MAIDTEMDLTAVVRTRDRSLLREYGGVQGIVRALCTDLENGIPGDDNDISARRNAFGNNCADQNPRTPPLVKVFHLCAKAIKDPWRITLLVFCSLYIGMKLVSRNKVAGILEVLVVVIAPAMVHLYRHDFPSAHNPGDEPQVDVVRKCGWMKIPISGVVVGDMVFLKPGDQVPADGLFIDGHSFHLETVSQSKGKQCRGQEEVGEKNPFIYSGDMVADGYCRMVVTAVGKSCENQPQKQMGRYAHKLQILTNIGNIGEFFGMLTLRCFLFYFSSGEEIIKEEYGGVEEKFFRLALALTLAYSIERLLDDRVLNRSPSLCHQVASADTVCINKTGTLTSDFLEVKKFWLGLNSMEAVTHHLIATNVLELLHQAIGLNTTQPRLSSTFAPSLSLTEQAIHDWATNQLGMEAESLRRSCTILEIEPFTPSSRRSGVLISKTNAIHMHRKGAADLILPMCSYYYEATGKAQVIDISTRMLLEQIVRSMEESGLRCIAFAHRKTSIDEYFNLSKQKLTLLGLVGLKNPMRNGVKRAVEDCERAGIKVKLLTGDSTSTAKFMALKGGLLDSDFEKGQVVEGIDFRNYTAEERMENVDRIRVLAKATPWDKFLMVETLKRNGRIVAYVGGGQGDVQAIEEANVGICFGTESGAEILKTCSDVVIKEKKFPLIVEILKWRRGFHDSIETYAQFLLLATFVDLGLCFAIIATSTAKVLKPVFLLFWVKLIVARVAAHSVFMKQLTEDLMSMPARDPKEPLITDSKQRNIIRQALYQIVVLLAIHFVGKSLLNLNPNEKINVISNTYVLCQVFTLINAKLYPGRKNLFQEIHNKRWFWGIGIIIVLQVMMVELCDSIAGTRMDARQWGLCIFMATASTPISFLFGYICPINIPYLTSAKGSDLKSKIE